MEKPPKYSPQPEHPSWENFKAEEFNRLFEQEEAAKEISESDEDLFTSELEMKDEGTEINELKRKKRELLQMAYDAKNAGKEREGEKLLDEAYAVDTKIFDLRYPNHH